MSALCLAVVAIAVVTGSGSGDAATSFSFAFVGDIPYSDADVDRMSDLADHVNAHDVEFVAHAGDIKPATARCTDALIRGRFDMFQEFDGAFWLTPGDNDWTDCRDADRTADPLERLDFLRSVFYPVPTRTTGRTPLTVQSQSRPFVENVVFRLNCVTFGSIHQVGSSNGSSSWPNETSFDRERREAEVAARLSANAAWVDRIFADADATGSRGVFLLMQAMPRNVAYWGDVTDRIVAGARDFDGDVIVAHGDGHSREVEERFLGRDNITRWETAGGTGATGEWIRVDVDCGASSVFSHRVIQTGAAVPPPAPTTASTTPTTTTTTPTSAPTTTIGPGPVAPVAPTTVAFDLDGGATGGEQAERGEQIHFPNMP